MNTIFPTDKVRICKKDICIEARGQNALLLIAAVVVALTCIAAFYISKIK